MIAGFQGTRRVPATLEISYFPSKSQFTTNICQFLYKCFHRHIPSSPTCQYPANLALYRNQFSQLTSLWSRKTKTFQLILPAPRHIRADFQMSLKYIMARIDRKCCGYFCTNVVQLVPILIMRHTRCSCGPAARVSILVIWSIFLHQTSFPHSFYSPWPGKMEKYFGILKLWRFVPIDPQVCHCFVIFTPPLSFWSYSHFHLSVVEDCFAVKVLGVPRFILLCFNFHLVAPIEGKSIM